MKTVFVNTVPGLRETWPIEPMSKHLPKWINIARQDYIQNKHSKKNHVFRCHGIADLYKAGFVIRSWHDVEVTADENNISIRRPNKLESEYAVDVQRGDDIAKFIPKRPWSSKSILKLNTPWHLISGTRFLMLPLPYSDDHVFEACPGVLDPSISTEVNVQMYWNKHGTHLLTAGTPLCYIIPMCKQTIELEMRDATSKDLEWIQKRHYVNSMSFNLNIQKIKQFFKDFWKD